MDTDITMSMADTITNELNKLLEGKEPIKEKEEQKNQANTESKEETIEESKEKTREEAREEDSEIADVRCDILKLLGMLETLNNELDKQKEKNALLAAKVASLTENVQKTTDKVDTMSKNSDNGSIDTETYQENLDRILSNKLDEFTVKVEKKFQEIDKFMLDTRSIARKKGPKLTN